MHPIERLRFVARAQGVAGEVLAVEAASALMTFADDPAALVAASRRVLSRQVSCGPLWWVCARMLTVDRIREVGRQSIDLLEADTTGAAGSLALDLLDDEAPAPVLVQALAVGDGGAVVVASQWESMTAHRGEGNPRWLVGGVGCRLSDPMWSSLVEHWSTTPRRGEELVPLDAFTHLLGPDGPVPVDALGPPDCPVAPELFRLVG